MALGAPMLRGRLRRPCTTPALTRVPRRGCGRSREEKSRTRLRRALHPVREVTSIRRQIRDASEARRRQPLWRSNARTRNLEFRVSHRVRNLISANSEVYHGAMLTIRTSLRVFASVFPLTRRATSTSEKSLLAPSPSVLTRTAEETFEAA